MVEELLFLPECDVAAEESEAIRELRLRGQLHEALERAASLVAAHPEAEGLRRERALCLLHLGFFEDEFRRHVPCEEPGEDGLILQALVDFEDLSTGKYLQITRNNLSNQLAPTPTLSAGWLNRRRLILGVAHHKLAALEGVAGPVAEFFRAQMLTNSGRTEEASRHLQQACDDPVLESVRRTCLELLPSLEKQSNHEGCNLVLKAWRLAQARHWSRSGGWLKHPVARHVARHLGPITQVFPGSGDPPWALIKVVTPPWVRWISLGMSWHWNGGRSSYPHYTRELMVTAEPGHEGWARDLLERLARTPRVASHPDTVGISLSGIKPFAGVVVQESVTAPEPFSRSLSACGLVQAVYPVYPEEIARATHPLEWNGLPDRDCAEVVNPRRARLDSWLTPPVA